MMESQENGVGRTAGTCECAPASQQVQVDAMHSMYMLMMMSGIPSPPHVRGVCMTPATLSLSVADPRKPRVRCIHCDVRPLTRSNRAVPNRDATLDGEE